MYLAVHREFVQGQVAERTMGTVLIVIRAPRFEQLLGVVERQELMHVQARIAQAPY